MKHRRVMNHLHPRPSLSKSQKISGSPVIIMETLRMQTVCLIVIVMVCLVKLVGGEKVDCSNLSTHHLLPCAEGKVCVWNHCRCPGKSWCLLMCSSDPREWCTGLHRGDSCNLEVPSTCQKSRKLVCIPRVTIDEDPVAPCGYE